MLIKSRIYYGKLEGNIEKQLFQLFVSIGLLDEPEQELKEYYKKLLTSSNEEIRYSMWQVVPNLLSEQILSTEDFQEMKDAFLHLFESKNKNIRTGLLFVLPGIIKNQLLGSDEVYELVSKIWLSKDESDKAFALGTLSSMAYDKSDFRYEVMTIMRRLVFQLIKSSNINDLTYGWIFLPRILDQTLDQQRDTIYLKSTLRELEDVLLYLLTYANTSKEINILVHLCFLKFFLSYDLLDNSSDFAESLSKLVAKGLFSNNANVQKFFVILLSYSIRKEVSSEELERIDDNEMTDFLQEIMSKTIKVAVRSEQQLLSLLSANIKNEVITMKRSRQLKEDFFDMLKNPNLDDKMYAFALAILTYKWKDGIIQGDELQQLISEVLHISNRNVRTITTLPVLFDLIRHNQNKTMNGQVKQLEKEFKDMLFEMLKNSDNNIRTTALSILLSVLNIEDPKEIMQLKAVLLDMLKNSDKNIRTTALATLSALLHKKENIIFLEPEEILQLTKQLIDISSDMLKNSDKDIRVSAFFVLMSVFDMKRKDIPFEYEKKLLPQMLVNALAEIMKEEDTDFQFMVLSSLRPSFLEELIEFDESQAKPLRDFFYQYGKKSSLARRYTAKLGTVQSGQYWQCLMTELFIRIHP